MKIGITIFVILISNAILCAQDLNDIKWISVVNQNMSQDFENTPIFRLPVMVCCNNGDIIIGSEAKNDKDEFQFYAISLSNNSGLSFTAKRSEIAMAELVYDKINDRVFSYAINTFYASDDHGKTWYDYKSNLNIVKPDYYDIYCMSPTTGIQLKNGILVVPLRFVRFKRDSNGKKMGRIDKTTVFLLYSKDYGKTWQQTPMTPSDIIADEVAIVEYADNQVMLNARGGTEYFWEKSNNGRRVFVPQKQCKSPMSKWIIDGWKLEKKSDGKINDPICHASILNATIKNKTVGLFCNPDMPEGVYWPRTNMYLRVSRDFKHWQGVMSLTPKDYPLWGYSALASNNNRIYFAYEDKNRGILFCDLEFCKDKILKSIKR